MYQAISGIPSIRGGTHAPSALRGALAAVVAAFRRVVRERRLRDDIGRVEALDGRMLADIGIGRGEAESAVRHGRTRFSASAVRPLPPERPLGSARWTEWR